MQVYCGGKIRLFDLLLNQMIRILINREQVNKKDILYIIWNCLCKGLNPHWFFHSGQESAFNEVWVQAYRVWVCRPWQIFVSHGRFIQIFCHMIRSHGVWAVLCWPYDRKYAMFNRNLPWQVVWCLPYPYSLHIDLYLLTAFISFAKWVGGCLSHLPLFHLLTISIFSFWKIRCSFVLFYSPEYRHLIRKGVYIL